VLQYQTRSILKNCGQTDIQTLNSSIISYHMTDRQTPL